MLASTGSQLASPSRGSSSSGAQPAVVLDVAEVVDELRADVAATRAVVQQMRHQAAEGGDAAWAGRSG
jgi:hypothetical protein